MGFDNECILNIQSLAGEYFCPVCRLLVYPNEALQSQCTHLYCKPCLTYVVSTTRACPYDGYLVTEADSKPLVESNKTLAETIGKIMVHCLYHRSGCTWQGPLSECTGHCSGCAFGNSPVVCNRCGIQIVHRQVQEHAQNCPQSLQAEGGEGTAATADQTELASQAGTATSQAQASQTTTSSRPAQDPNQQANPISQSQAVSQAAVVASEQWYQQQQQQYQQYYQQYSGYDPYYQQYYPYQQQAVPQYQQQSLQINASHMAGQHPAFLQTQPQPQPQVQPPPQVQPQVQPQLQPQAQPQSHSSVLAPVAAQPQNQAQINQHKQAQLMVPPHSQIPSQTYTTAQGHPQPHIQPFPQAPTHLQVLTIQPHLQHGQMPQYQQLHSQMQQQQPQLHPTQAQPQPQPQPQPQLQPQLQPQPQPQTQPQPLPQPQPQPLSYPQPSQPLNPNLMPQTLHPSAHAVTGHQSYLQPQPHQQMQLVTPQHPLPMHAQGGLHLQQHPAEMQNSYPQQPPQMRPPQSHATFPNAQQPGLLPLPGPMLQQVPPPSLQSAFQVQQRPVIQPSASPMSQQLVQQQPLSTQPLGLVQPQMHQQGPFLKQQQSLQSQLPPLGPPHSFQQPPLAYSQPQQTLAGSHAVHPHPSHDLVGRPVTPNHGVQSLHHPQSAAAMPVIKPMQLGANQLSSYQNNVFKTNNQPGVTSQPMSEVPGDHGTDKNVAEQGAESSSLGIDKKEANELDVASSLGADVADTSTSKSNVGFKSVDEKHTGDVGDSIRGFDISTKETPESRQTFGTDLGPNRESVSTNTVKGEAIEVLKDVDNGEPKVEENKIKDDGPLLKISPLQEAKFGEEQNLKMQKDQILPQDQGTPKGHAGNGFRGIPPSNQVQLGGFQYPSRSVLTVDQGRHQPLQMPCDDHQKPAASAMLHAPPPGVPPNQFRPQGPGHVVHPGQTLVPPENLAPGSFGRGPINYAPQGPYNQGPSVSGAPRISQGEPLVRPPFGAPSYGPEAHLVQQHSANMDYHADNRQLDRRAAGLGSTSAFSLPGERSKHVQDEHLNPFSWDRAHTVGDRGQLEEDLKQFPRPSHLDTEPVPKFVSHSSSRPLDRRPHGFGMDMGPRAHEKDPHRLNFDPMIGSGRFLPPYHPDDAGDRPVGLREDNLGRPDFPGTVPSYGRHHMDGFVSRSPGREYPGISPHGFGRHPGVEIDGRERRFNDRFTHLPGHQHRGGFESSDHMAEHLRSRDMIGPDIRPPHFRRGEHLGHHNMPGHLRMGEPIGFGEFSSHDRMGEFGGPGNFRHPRLGEPGFRSSFSLREFPNDGGIFTGDIDSFENLRKRKPVSMGWCRICKVDCETVEGLDLHSQTREHQKMAMDMVVTIKQNAKKQKITSSDHSIRNDSSKSNNAKVEGLVNKH